VGKAFHLFTNNDGEKHDFILSLHSLRTCTTQGLSHSFCQKSVARGQWVELTDLTNRRHNRNLQHSYDLELSTEFKKDLNSKINKNVGKAFHLKLILNALFSWHFISFCV
jgi:hypothetical protein